MLLKKESQACDDDCLTNPNKVINLDSSLITLVSLL